MWILTKTLQQIGGVASIYLCEEVLILEGLFLGLMTSYAVNVYGRLESNMAGWLQLALSSW